MHLFIVSETTLPIHLQYGFAGVKKSSSCSWANITINASSERSQAALYADMCRVHQGDECLFYLERPSHDIGREGGRFLGIFEVISPFPFYEPDGIYLLQELGIPLVYRVEIQPKEIFQDGVTEWQAMDEMTNFRTIYDIPWTLIYRKMVGGRGCTPLLPHEGEALRKMLDLRNAGQRVSFSSTAGIEFNPSTVQLVSGGHSTSYQGNTSIFDRIDVHLEKLMREGVRKWELHLQAYLMQEIKRNNLLTEYLFPNVEITWIGNEIYAGAGMQSIDILVFSRNKLNTFIHLIELKSEAADKNAAAQLNRYIKWLKAHIPDISVHQIVPTIIAPAVADRFHQEMQIYLQGHGISQYRVVVVDHHLSFNQSIHTVNI